MQFLVNRDKVCYFNIMLGCLVVHGLTGTPITVASLQDKLLSSGFRVIAPCLAGHGTTVEELSRAKWQDWYETVRIAYGELRRSVEKVYYVGMSLGALLGLKLAIDEGWGIRALALVGTPLVLTRLENFAVPLVKYTPLRFALHSVKKDFEKSVGDPEGRNSYKAASLPRIPVNAIYELVHLQKIVKGQLKQVTNPVLLVHAKNDRVAPPRNVALVKNGVSSDIVESVFLENSEHVVTMDRDKELVAEKVVEFFQKFG
jgi:carboxylesterase